MLIATPIKLTKTERTSIQSFTEERIMALSVMPYLKKMSAETKQHAEAVIFNAITSAYFCGRKMVMEKKSRNHKPALNRKIAVNEKEKCDYKKRRK